MSVEYYLVKPSKKEIMCIGKHLNLFTGINRWSYNSEADHIEYDSFGDFLDDVFLNNKSFFDENPFKVDKAFLYKVYEFCNAPVYLDNDCSSNLAWENYKEVDGIYEFYKEIEND